MQRWRSCSSLSQRQSCRCRSRRSGSEARTRQTADPKTSVIPRLLRPAFGQEAGSRTIVPRLPTLWTKYARRIRHPSWLPNSPGRPSQDLFRRAIRAHASNAPSSLWGKRHPDARTQSGHWRFARSRRCTLSTQKRSSPVSISDSYFRREEMATPENSLRKSPGRLLERQM